MSSSISSATTQQQFIQVPQNPAKTDTTDKTANTSNTNVQAVPPAQISQQSATATTANSVPESRFRRNNDGTYGPGHTAVAPFNPLQPSKQGSSPSSSQPDTSEVGVNVTI